MILGQQRKSSECLKWLRERGCDHGWHDGRVIPAGFTFEPPVRVLDVQFYGSVSIGAFSYFVDGTVQNSSFGRYCSIARDVNICPGSHPIDWLSSHPFQFRNDFRFRVGDDFLDSEKYKSHVVTKQAKASAKVAPVVVGNDVWIGNGAFILPGVMIGSGAIVAGRAVVTRDVPPYAIVAGNPAKIIRFRFDEAIIERLLNLQWWRFAHWQMSDLQFHDISSVLSCLEDRVSAGAMQPYSPGPVCVDAFGSYAK